MTWRRHLTTEEFLDLEYERAQPARFAAEPPSMVHLIPQPQVTDSGWGDLLAEPLLDMLTGERAS
jgi:hypothetical protein